MSALFLSRRSYLIGAGAALVAGCAKAGEPVLTARVHKDPYCGCCTAWVDHLTRAGFTAEVVETADLAAVRARLGVPEGLASCHTAEIGRYVVEGHVPAADIRRLLAENPAATGLAVPGMPVGSPGMEVASRQLDRYQVLLFGPNGVKVFAEHG